MEAFAKLSPEKKHEKLVQDYKKYYNNVTTDLDHIQKHHRFLWSEKDETDTWEKRMAKKYHDKLFKQYCLVDLSRYKLNQYAMRWRTLSEVEKGKGQFICANVECKKKEELKSWEVPFSYYEDGEKKQALVQVRLCPKCSYKLNYKHRKEEKARKRKREVGEGNEDVEEKKIDTLKQEKDLELGKEKEKKSNLDNEKEIQEKLQNSSHWQSSVASASTSLQQPSRSRIEEFDDFFKDLFQ